MAGRLQFAGHLQAPARTASGGNQQKLVIGKWVLTGAEILIFDEPTRGIDIGAKAEVYRLIHQLAAQGAAVILVSSELPELMNLCHRIVVMSGGRIQDELSGRIHRAAHPCGRFCGAHGGGGIRVATGIELMLQSGRLAPRTLARALRRSAGARQSSSCASTGASSVCRWWWRR